MKARSLVGILGKNWRVQMETKKVYVFNEGGYHLTISFQLWNWLRVWWNIGYPRSFVLGTYFGEQIEYRTTRDLTAILMALEPNEGPLHKLLRRANGN